MREFLTGHTSIHEIVDFAGLPVFANATVRTIVLICSPTPEQRATARYLAPVPMEDFATIDTGGRLSELVSQQAIDLPISSLSPDGWSLGSSDFQCVIDQMRKVSVPLPTYIGGRAYRGLITGLNQAFIIDRKTRDSLIASDPRNAEIIKPMLGGRNVRRYSIDFKDKYLIWTYIGVPIDKYPAIFEHLKRHQDRLKKRWDKGNHWWELRACDYYDKFEKPKIIYPDISTSCRFALDRDGYFGANTTYFIPGADLYLLGILNSKLAERYFSSVCAGLEGGGTVYLRFFGQYLEEFPVRQLNEADSKDKAQHDRMVALVEQILTLHQQLAAAKLPDDKRRLQTQIDATDAQIDQLVYELYGLTEHEIRIVEGGDEA